MGYSERKSRSLLTFVQTNLFKMKRLCGLSNCGIKELEIYYVGYFKEHLV